ncbi:MAG: LeuA family protein [Candidatus Roizmanbacteria bacterium]
MKSLIDTTFRDGQQSPLMFDAKKYRFTLEEKKTLLKGMLELGISCFEFFAPNVSEVEYDDFIHLRDIIRKKNKKAKLLAHCRCHTTDIASAIEAGFDGLNLYIGVADHSQKHSHGLSFREIINRVTETIIETRKKYPNLYLRFSTEDFFRTPMNQVIEIYDLLAPYVNTFGIPDTVGIATPDMVKERVGFLRERYPDVDLECHFHNDRGFALINAYTAVEAGVAYVDTSIWGMAERSGITSTSGFILNYQYINKKDCEKKYNIEFCYPLNVLMASILNLHVPHTEPVSLTNRTHTAGVHQKAVLNDKIVYEAHDLSRFGVNKNQLLLGPLSGWNLILYYLQAVENFYISSDTAIIIAKEFKKRVKEINKKNSPEKLLLSITEKFKIERIALPDNFSTKRLENLT